ncbi:sensor histidine kinase [Flavobacterium sp. RHBU_24]|uniref:sensor histidine kinase n=1 Tax=Flavobacterium sp. RHBU_24 TaxID=3391185 RepID=UPI00398466ED
MKKYRLLTGTIISLFMALLSFLPQMLQPVAHGAAAIFVNVATIFVFGMSCWLVNQHLFLRKDLPSTLRGQLPRIAISFLFSFLLSYILLHVIRHEFGSERIFSIRQFSGRRRLINVIILRGIFVNAFLYFIGYVLYLNDQNQQAQLENGRLKHENLEARLHVLRQQLSPHFLFNSLGILNTLTNDATVRKYIIQLSHIYRYLLAGHENHLAGLRQEMDFINSYLYIIKERFEDALQINIDISPADMDKKLPPAALQLLIENAIKHNVVSADEPLFITIYSRGGYVVVSNTLNLKINETTDANGIGLHNITERYKLLSGREVVIERDATSFTVKLPLIL